MRSLSLITLSFLVLLSCSQGDTTLEISVTPESTFFLPGDITFEDDACYDDSTISEPRFKIDTVKTAWSGEGTFQPIALKISFSGIGNTVSNFECVISGRSDSSLAAFLGFPGSSLSQGESAETSTCSVHCGGVNILSDDTQFSVTARVELIGIQILADESEVPVKATTTVLLRNIL